MRESRFLTDPVSGDVRKVHSSHALRAGGGILVLGFAVGILSHGLNGVLNIGWAYFEIIYLALGVFLVGFIEDIYGKLTPSKRIWSVLILVLVAQLGIDFQITSIDVTFLDEILAAGAWVTLAFTSFAILGLVNAFNITDGLNGLSSGLALVALAFLYLIAEQANQSEIAIFASLSGFSLAGFYLVNVTTGRLFLGDSGAYFLGVMIAVLSIILSESVENVSPWFFLCLTIYPVTETLFSIFRRSWKGRHVGNPDGLHLHTLLFGLLSREMRRVGTSLTHINTFAGAVIVLTSLLFAGLCFYVRSDTKILIYLISGYTLLYAYVYAILYRLVAAGESGSVK